jgi:hypothetical protein
VERTPLIVREVVTFVVGHEIDDRAIGERRRLVQDEATLLDTRSKRTHGATLRGSETLGKWSAAPYRGICPSISAVHILTAPDGDAIPFRSIPSWSNLALSIGDRLHSTRLYGVPLMCM